MRTKEIIELTEKWNQRITDISIQYAYSVKELDNIRGLLETQLKSNWQKTLTIIPIILPLIFFIVSIVFIYTVPCGIEVKFNGIEMKRICLPDKSE